MIQETRIYELVAPAGVGGMATVWRARMIGEHGFERTVAVKRLLPALADDEAAITMFEEEARITSELHHPNIVQVHGLCRDDRGQLLIVMEWVEGLDLARWSRAWALSGLPVPWPLATAIAIDVLRGLDAAHSRTDGGETPAPVFHRDVSPSNVIVSTSGVAMITDFGMARAADRAAITQPGVLKGKMPYMAPEYVGGGTASAATDQWALSALLWELLACRRMRTETDPMKLFGLAGTPSPRIEDVRSDLPEALVDTLHLGLEIDPGRRHPSARAMARALALALREADDLVDDATIAASVHEARARLVRTEKLIVAAEDHRALGGASSTPTPV